MTTIIETGPFSIEQNDKGHISFIHPGAVAILAITYQAGKPYVILVEQNRPTVNAVTLEIPAGTLDIKGEAPEKCAARELEEETGYTCKALKHLLDVYPSPGYSSEVIKIFLADNCTFLHASEEGVVNRFIPLSDIGLVLCSGKVVDGKTATGLLLLASGIAKGTEPTKA